MQLRLCLCLLLTACGSCPVIEPVKVPVRVTEPVNAELTKTVPVYERIDGSCGQYREQAIRNTASAKMCNTQLESISGAKHENGDR